MKRTYRVEGCWPFPLDMLRHDLAEAAGPDDERLIARMSGAVSDDEFGVDRTVTIELVMEAGEATRARPRGRWIPNHRRWESFGWRVVGDPDVDDIRAIDAHFAALAASGE